LKGVEKLERDEKKNLARVYLGEGCVIRTSGIFGLFSLPISLGTTPQIWKVLVTKPSPILT
jgi:hypothetical protein